MMSANLRAFLFLVRWAEGTSDENGYRALYGHLRDRPKLFDDFSDHPRQAFMTPWGWTSAAGAFQFMATVQGKVKTDTWDRAKQALGLPDFSPESQDKAAVWLIEKRGALPAIERGDLADALARCSYEWASLPIDRNNTGRYGQPARTFDSCETIFERAGGTLLQGSSATQPSAAPPPPAAPSPAPIPTEKAMPLPVAAIAALGVELIKLLPFAKKPDNAKAVETIGPQLVAIAKEVAGPASVNEQAAVEAVQRNPQLQQQFVAQAVAKWSDLAPAWEAEEKSREAARGFVERMTGDGPEWRQIGTAFIVGLLSLIIIGGGGVLFWRMMDSAQLDPGQKGLILGALIAAFGQAIGFWFGSSATSRAKDVTIAEQAKR